MVEAGGDWISAPEAARLLGLQHHTVLAMIDKGELAADFTLPYPGPKSRRRAIRLRRRDVDAFIERSRIKPGDLRHLYPQMPGTRYR